MIRVFKVKDVLGDNGINETFARLITKFRTDRGHTVPKFAELLGVQPKAINRLEQEGACASVGDLLIMSMYLGLKASQFWSTIRAKSDAEIEDLEYGDHATSVYGLNEEYYRKASYADLCKGIEKVVAGKLKTLIKNNSKSHNEIASELGRPRNIVAKIGDGDKIVRLSDLEKLCEVLGVESEQVIDDVVTTMEQLRIRSGKRSFQS